MDENMNVYNETWFANQRFSSFVLRNRFLYHLQTICEQDIFNINKLQNNSRQKILANWFETPSDSKCVDSI